MKTTLKLLAILSLLLTINYPLSTAHVQGTAFTYQGRLNSGANPANGTYDFVFAVYGSPNGTLDGFANQTNAATPVSNGLFTVTMNLGQPGIFTGPDRWLDIAVRTNVSGTYTTLTPRQLLTPAPYAIYSANAASATSLSVASNQTVNLTANGNPVLRIASVFDPSSGSYTANSVGGYSGNVVSNGYYGGFIGGGGNLQLPNMVGNSYASVVGGLGN
jgi:hypothetical protein